MNALKTLNTHSRVVLGLSFPHDIIFIEALFFLINSISLPTIKGVLYNAIQIH